MFRLETKPVMDKRCIIKHMWAVLWWTVHFIPARRTHISRAGTLHLILTSTCMYIYKRVVYHLKAVKPKCTQQKDSFPLGESWRDCDETVWFISFGFISRAHLYWAKAKFLLILATARCEQKIGFARKSSGSSIAFAFAFAPCKWTLNVHNEATCPLLSNCITAFSWPVLG